jgi:MoxR-like ATPase
MRTDGLLSVTSELPPTPDNLSDRVGDQRPRAAAQALGRLRENIGSVLLGHPAAIDLALVTLLADGHLLIEDVPGIGKTLLAKAMARSLDCRCHRIQFTPDLLPSDLIGTSVFHQPSGEFIFKEGPLFAHVILADEINRATPRTQSALLEAMSDRQVSVDGCTRPLGPPFLVLATQNPFEFEGTFPLPESQMDRFLLRLHLGYPDRQFEKEVLTRHRAGEPVETLKPVMDIAAVAELQHEVRQVRVDDSLNDYILDLVTATREHAGLYLGASTRAALALYRAAQAQALLEGRDYVVPDDVKRLARPVLAHRLLAKGYRQGARGDAAEEITKEIVEQTPLPA